MERTGKKISHRDRKNQSANEAWRKSKKARNAAQPPQLTVTEQDGKIVGPFRMSDSAFEPPTVGNEVV